MGYRMTKNEMIGLINRRIDNIATDEDGWAEPERKIVIAELKMLIKKIQAYPNEPKKSPKEMRGEV